MNTPEIITWLREQAKRVPEEVHRRGMIQAADALEELEERRRFAAVCGCPYVGTSCPNCGSRETEDEEDGN